MLRLIEGNSDALQAAFEAFIRKACDKEFRGRLAHPGRSFEATMYWFDMPGLWVSFRKPGRYWNAYGFAKPVGFTPVSIDFEVNYPCSGLDRRIAACLAQDETGATVLAHRGKFGAGRVGLTREEGLRYFRLHLPQRMERLQERDLISDVILVGPLINGIESIAEFGRAVVALKQNYPSRS